MKCDLWRAHDMAKSLLMGCTGICQLKPKKSKKNLKPENVFFGKNVGFYQPW